MPLPHLIGLFVMLCLFAVAGQPVAEREPEVILAQIEATSAEGIKAAIRASVIETLAERKAPAVDLVMTMLVTEERKGFQVYIRWAVYDLNGKHLGTVEQRNTLPEIYEAESQTWAAAGRAAAVGVMKLLGTSEDEA